MKKNKLSNFLKTGILLFGISLLLWNCEKEDINNFEVSTKSNTPFETISFKSAVEQEEFNEIAKASKTEKYFREPINNYKEIFSKSSTEKKNSFEIIKKSVKKIKKENYTSYTFLIKREKDNYSNSSFENLVVEKKNNEIKAFIIKYEPSLEYSQSKNLPFSGKLSVQKIDYDSSFLSKIQAECGWVETYTRRDCTVHGYNGVNVPECNNYGKDSFAYSSSFVCFSGGGGGSGTPFESGDTPSGGGGGGSQGGSSTSPVYPCEDPIHGCDEIPHLKLANELGITDQNRIDYLENNPILVDEINTFLDNNSSLEANLFANEIISAGVNGILISAFPFVKYPVGSNYATLYPKLTEYLKNQLPRIKNNSTIINKIVKYGDLPASEVKKHLEWGKGPEIQIKQLGANYGIFNGNYPNVLSLDIDLVKDLENTTPNTKLANAFSFLIGVTILHEYVHYSEYTDKSWNSPESGELFEIDLYGQTVWRSNASIILKGN